MHFLIYCLELKERMKKSKNKEIYKIINKHKYNLGCTYRMYMTPPGWLSWWTAELRVAGSNLTPDQIPGC